MRAEQQQKMPHLPRVQIRQTFFSPMLTNSMASESIVPLHQLHHLLQRTQVFLQDNMPRLHYRRQSGHMPNHTMVIHDNKDEHKIWIGAHSHRNTALVYILLLLLFPIHCDDI